MWELNCEKSWVQKNSWFWTVVLEKTLESPLDWGQEERRTTEDEMAGWHHWLDGRESGWTLGVGDGQGGLACCNSWGCKELDTTERLNWTELKLNSECFAFPLFFILCSYSCIWQIITCLHYVFIFIVMSTRGCESDVIFKTVNSWRDDLWEMSSDALYVSYWLAHFEALQLPWSFHFVWLST